MCLKASRHEIDTLRLKTASYNDAGCNDGSRLGIYKLLVQIKIGAQVCSNDPYIPVLSAMRKYPDLSMESVEIDEKQLQSMDCVLIATDHSSYDYQFIDYQFIYEQSQLIVDTRNVMKGFKSDKLFKA